ncbi:MAG: hypothetical protein M3R62_13525, partial [Acidobacteriota bacterium]|nr:hypothetical protein [Acidobacteriota bacterium]
GEVSFLFGRSAYRTPPECRVPALLESALGRRGVAARRGAMTYWTDAAILGEAGTPSVVFGPGGAGLHGLEEYVRVDEVIACRDAIVLLAHEFCGSSG